ncbi:hypothetical protein D9758_004236 [Tetrapyrgos nigripes]|uniref:Protein kinase domain-containing protein n=1 Tax=Tetrapyrgos nigripes TaxID=182062 RepID=A0A8H5LV85_9AGAR|nr:hypothetical protein D9758_004236 [Tetrapyrgos nigripes]
MSSVWTAYVTTWDLLQSAEVVAYFDAVEAEFGESTRDGKDWHLRQWFFDAVDWWWNRQIETHDFINWMSFTSLASSPALFQGLSVLLEMNSERVVVSTSDDDRAVEYAILLSYSSEEESGPQAQIIPISSFAKNAACVIRDTRVVRDILGTSEPMSYLLDIDAFWAPGLMELLQFELDNLTPRDVYRRKCLKCIRGLEKKYHVLPPSLFLKNIVRDGYDALGGGGFADIWKGQLSGQIVGIKVPRMFTASDQETKEKVAFAFRHEALLWRQLNHPNVLPFLGVNVNLFNPTRLCLISPWMENGNIIQYLMNHPDHDLLDSISDIAAGMDYLHNSNPPIVHGDIRGANILVTPDFRCCLADFGLSLATGVSQIVTSTSDGLKGCIRWLSPECITPNRYPVPDKEKDKLRKCRDVYAFACTITEIITLKPPFQNRPIDAAVIFDVIRGIRPERPSGPDVWCPDNIWDLIECCWAQNPYKRPNAHEVKKFLDFLKREKGQDSERKVGLKEWYLYSYSQSEESLGLGVLGLGLDRVGIEFDDEDRKSTWTVLDDGGSVMLSGDEVMPRCSTGDASRNKPILNGEKPGRDQPVSHTPQRLLEDMSMPPEMDDTFDGPDAAEIVKNLESRVQDWGEYSIGAFGSLLLNGLFGLTGRGSKQYEVFLFERILLCLEESRNDIVHRYSFNEPPAYSQSHEHALTLETAIFLVNVVSVDVQDVFLSIAFEEHDHPGYLDLHCPDGTQREHWRSTISGLIGGDPFTRFIRDALFDAVSGPDDEGSSDGEEEVERSPICEVGMNSDDGPPEEIAAFRKWSHCYSRDIVQLGAYDLYLDDNAHGGRLSPSFVLGSIMDLPDLDEGIHPLSADTDVSAAWFDHWKAPINLDLPEYDPEGCFEPGRDDILVSSAPEAFHSHSSISLPLSLANTPIGSTQRLVRFQSEAEVFGLVDDEFAFSMSPTKSKSPLTSTWESWDGQKEKRSSEISLSGVLGALKNNWPVKR